VQVPLLSWRSSRSAAVGVAATALLTAGPSAAMPLAHRDLPRSELVVTSLAGSATTAATARRTAETVAASMSLPQRVGQLFMVGTPATAADGATRRQIGRYHVGNVMLTGRSHAGTRTPRGVAATMRSQATRSATRGVKLLVATDQEGGQVQVLHGRGISEIPSAIQQGRFGVDRLRSASGRWARQLRAAGVNMNLAPVLDTVPSARAARSNPPIGAYGRHYGYTVTRVARHGTAFLRGMSANGVLPVVKHFPGLGRVHANTDTSSAVTDRTTRRADPYLRPFRTAVAAGAPFVMMSTAYYTRLDARNPAAFSPFVIGTVLRRDLGFRGVVISDDLASARQVARWRPGTRAVKFIGAGGDMVLTVSARELPAMYRAVLSRARNNPAFRTKVDRAALRVLRAKENRHLLGR
jgi:beta-N-acetylhexosaminidase